MKSQILIQGLVASILLFMAPRVLGQVDKVAEAAQSSDAALKPTPHMSDGHPDLNGVWHLAPSFGLVKKVGDNSFVYVSGGNRGENRGGSGNAAGSNAGAPPARPRANTPEYKPDFLAKVSSLNDNQVKEDQTLRCMPPGVPRIGPPQQILMTTKEAVFLYADFTGGNQWRVIPLDGRPRNTDPDAEPTYNGESVGHWEQDTLVIDVGHFIDETWLGDNGLFHTDKLHVVERLRRVGETLQYEMTANDPDVLAKPWTVSRALTLQSEALEESPPCVDHDSGHLVNLEHHGNER